MSPLLIHGEERHRQPAVFYPVIVCDVCGGRIADLRDGNYYWGPDLALPDPRTDAPVLFAHKTCNFRFERQYGRRAFEDLRRLPMFPWRNGGYSDREIRDALRERGLGL